MTIFCRMWEKVFRIVRRFVFLATYRRLKHGYWLRLNRTDRTYMLKLKIQLLLPRKLSYKLVCNSFQSHESITLQRHKTENSKQIFPEKELCGLSPNSHIHVSVSDLYIPTIGLPILCYRKICGPILGIYKSLTDTWMWKLGLRQHNSFSGNT